MSQSEPVGALDLCLSLDALPDVGVGGAPVRDWKTGETGFVVGRDDFSKRGVGYWCVTNDGRDHSWRPVSRLLLDVTEPSVNSGPGFRVDGAQVLLDAMARAVGKKPTLADPAMWLFWRFNPGWHLWGIVLASESRAEIAFCGSESAARTINKRHNQTAYCVPDLANIDPDDVLGPRLALVAAARSTEWRLPASPLDGGASNE